MGKTLRGAPLMPKGTTDLDYIEILLNALKEFHIPEEYCSIGEYAEEAICLEKTTPSWIVYEGERGKKYNIKTHINCRDACHDIISRIADSVDSERKLIDLFDLECEKNRFGRLRYDDYQELAYYEKGCQ